MNEKKNLMLFNSGGSKKGAIYKYVGWSNGFGKNATKWFSMGNQEKLLRINPNAIEIIKDTLKSFTNQDKPETIKTALFHAIEKSNIIKSSIFVGNELLNNFLDKHNFFETLKKTRHKNLKEVFYFLITKRLTDPGSIFNSFYEKDTYKTKIDSSVNSFYRLLDVVYQSGDDILKKLNEIVQFETNQQRKEIFFDSTTVYFESFEAQGLKHQGYSKDGKFKENQIVIGLACDKNGIPFHIKIFHGRTPDQNTFIPFILEIEKKYNIKNITVVADRGMSSARNIRFLEQKGYKFIISYRAKNTSRAFKEYVLNQSDFVEINQTLKYKFNDIFSTYKNKRENSNLRRRVITHSTIRAKKDKDERENIIKSFQNKLDKNGYIDTKKMISSKKCKFFKEIKNHKFELDMDKVSKDAEFDGIYVYETNLTNLSAKDVIDNYSKQWNIESNFRSLKTFLQIRPIFLRLDEHIIAHSIICFTSLTLLKLFTHKINSFYEKYGVLEKVTETNFINTIKKVRHRVEINKSTNKVINYEREDVINEPLIWNKFDEYQKIIIKNYQ